MIWATIIGVVLGALISVLGNMAAQWIAGKNERSREESRQDHESHERLRERRMSAYSEMLRITSGVYRKDLQYVELLEAYSQAELLVGDDEAVRKALRALYETSNMTRERAEKVGVYSQKLKKDRLFDNYLVSTKDARQIFLAEAQRQLGIEHQPTETSQQAHRPWWKRWLGIWGS